MAISEDSQRHARSLIAVEGFTGMEKYWGPTLLEESPERDFHITRLDDCFRIDMHRCSSRGFMLRNQLGISAGFTAPPRWMPLSTAINQFLQTTELSAKTTVTPPLPNT